MHWSTALAGPDRRTGSAGAHSRPQAPPGAPAEPRARIRIERGARHSFQWLPAQVAVHEFFHEVDALELLQPSVRAYAPVKRHAHFPRPGKHFGIVDRGFVAHVVRPAARITLHDAQPVGMKIPGA